MYINGSWSQLDSSNLKKIIIFVYPILNKILSKNNNKCFLTCAKPRFFSMGQNVDVSEMQPWLEHGPLAAIIVAFAGLPECV